MTALAQFANRFARLAALLALAVPATAQTTTTWTGTTSSAWNVAANWSAGVPSAGIDAIVAAAPNAPSTNAVVGAACQSLTVQAGGTLTIDAGFDLAVQANVTWDGGRGGSGALVLAGTGIAVGSFPTTLISGNYAVRTLTVNGDLTQTAGTLTFDGTNAANLHVLGNATFQGATLTGQGAPTILDVDGNLTLNTTGLVTQATNHPTTIRCAGNWTSSANWQPVAGTVVFDGTAAQTVVTNHPSGTCRWFHLTLAAGSAVSLPPALPLDVQGDLTANDSLTTSTSAIDVAGNFAIAAGVTVAANAATTLRVRGALTIDGTLQAQSAQLLADGDFDLRATGSATLGAGTTHTFLANVTSLGALASGAGSTFLLQGAGAFASAAGSAAFPTTVVASSRTARNCTMAGDLTQTAGTIFLDGSVAAVLHVLGNATFQGTTLTGSGASSTIDVDGSLTLATTALLSQANNHPSVIRCGGNWTSNANYQPAVGTVVFDGTGPQTVATNHPSGTAQWIDLTIAPGASVALPPGLPLQVLGRLSLGASLTSSTPSVDIGGDLTIASGITLAANSATLFHAGGALTIAGVLDVQAARLVCDGSFLLAAGGTANLGAGKTHTFSASVDSQGTLNGGAGSTLRLQGAGTFASGAGSAALPSTVVANSYTGRSCTINGDFTQTAGTLSFDGAANATLHVFGNAAFQGTTLTGSGAATTLDVDGNITLATTALFDQSSNHPTTIRCAGNWTANANWQPAAGTVVFDGSAPQAIATNQPLNVSTWSHLTIAAGATVTPPAGQPLAVLGNLAVSGSLIVGAPTCDVGGDLTIASGASLLATAAATLHVAGTLTIQGTLNGPNAQLLCDGDFLLAATGTATLGAGRVHTVRRNVTSLGTLTSGAGSSFLLSGPGSLATGAGTSGLPDITLGADFTTTGATINGNLTQAAGTVTLDARTGPATLHVLGNATFLGVTVTALGTPTVLDVDGNLSLQTTAPVTQIVGPSTIRCAGNWDSNANYLPIAGTVEFDGTAPQSVTAVALTLPSTFIRSGNVTFTLQTLNVLRDMTVEAPFTTPLVSLTVQNDLIVTATGTVNVGAGTHVVKHSVAVASGGSTQGFGEIIVDGTLAGAAFATAGVGTIGNLRVRNGTVSGNTATVTGTLTLESGLLVVAGNLNANGNVELAGGTLTGTGALTIGGTATLTGTLAGSQLPSITALGDWVSDTSFQPLTGAVLFLPPPGGSTILPRAPGTQVALHEIQIQGGNLNTGQNLDLEVQLITIAAGAMFTIADSHLSRPAGSSGPVAVNASGELRLPAGSAWQIEGGTLISVEASGKLSLLGTPADPCLMLTDGSGPWALQVAGALDAHDFALAFGTFTSPADIGLRIQSTVTAANITVRDGELSADGTLAPTAAMVALENCPSLDFHGLTFRSFIGGACRNAVTTAAAPRRYRFFNWEGDLGGPSFEVDPNNVIDWIGRGRTELQSLSAQAGVGRTFLDVTTTKEVNSAALRLERSLSPTAGFVFVQNIAPLVGSETAGAAYQVIDTGLTPLQRVYYRVFDDLPGRPLRLLGEVSAIPWPSQIGTTLFVGPGGFASIGAALAVANAGDRVMVATGTYPAFTLNSAVSVLADSSGTVAIDTSAAPLRVQGLPANAPPVVLAGLTIGGPTAPFGLVLNGCQNIVVLDELDVTVDPATTTAVAVDGCPRLALQGLVAHGLDGLRIATQSTAYLDRGDVTSILCTPDSQLTHAGVIVAVPPTSPTVSALPGLPPRIVVPPALSGLTPYTATIEGTQNELWFLLLGTPSFVDPGTVLPSGLVLLLEPASMQILGQGVVGGTGEVAIPFTLASDPQVWGQALHVQTAALDPFRTPLILIGNLRTCALVP